ncbi:MAG: right-handed parallel beta-helix repeat-containing protein [Candidatus Omnitrophica bacterium]|nr:right-handed parallel beta-helix repeat-containing protein [Candidatus Omnitrophota bacterium]
MPKISLGVRYLFIAAGATALFAAPLAAQDTITLQYDDGKIVLIDPKSSNPNPLTVALEKRVGSARVEDKSIFWLFASEEPEVKVKPLSSGMVSQTTSENISNPVINSVPTPSQRTEQNRKEFITSAPTQNMDEPVQESPTAQPEPDIIPDPIDSEPPVDPINPPDIDPRRPVVQLPVNHTPTVQNVTFNTNEDGELRETLSGTDEDNNQLTFSQVNANPLHGTLTINPNGTFQYVPVLNYNGIDSFQYKANDGSIDSNIGIVTINILAVNDLPLASAGSNQTVPSGSIVQLDGSNSIDSIEGSDLTYLWTQSGEPTVTLDNLESPTPTFRAPTGPVTLIFYLSVTDSENGFRTDSVTITVEAPISQGTTYYIDQYHANANDSNTGTSEDQPWKTINSDLINALSPGDTILIKGDASGVGVYRKMVNTHGFVGPGITSGAPVIAISDLHGEPGAEITIKNYPDHEITIDTQDEVGNRHASAFWIIDSSYIRIEGLRLINPWQPAIYMFNSTSNSIIQDIYVKGNPLPGFGYTYPGIHIRGGSQNTVRHSTITGCSGGGIFVDTGFGQFSPLKNLIEENHIYGNQYAGIHVSGGSGHSILRNVLHHGNSGVWITSAAGGHLVKENILYREVDGISITAGDTVSSGNIIRNNIAFKIGCKLSYCGGSAYQYWSLSDTPAPHGDLFYHNIAAYAPRIGNKLFRIGGNISPSDPLILRNNIAAGTGDVEFRPASGYSSNFNLWDNVTSLLHAPGNREGANSIFDSARFSNIGLLDIDDNNDGTPDVFDSLNDPEATFAKTEEAVNYAHTKVREIFTLMPISQAIGHGSPITYTDPVTGNPVTIPFNGSAPDMGAFES